MKNKHIFILIALLIFACIVINRSEKFVPYRTMPLTKFEKWRTGSTPIDEMYIHPIYRQPFRDGYYFHSSFPYPHMTNLGTSLGNEFR